VKLFSNQRPIVGKSAFIFALCTLLSAPCSSAHAQPGKIPTVGFLLEGFSSAVSDATRIEAFRKGLQETGYTEGKTVLIEYRFAEGKRERLPALARELVRLKPDVIVTYGTVGALALKEATTTIPIVTFGSGDPVGRGLVTSLARPGGNVTGLSGLNRDLSGKRLELLKEVIPKLTRVAVLWDASGSRNNFKETGIAAQAVGVQLQSLDVRSAEAIERAFKAATERKAQALIMLANPFTTAHATRIAELAIQNRLPSIFSQRVYVESGGLMSYSPNLADLARRTAVYVDKILKGAKPADLPVEQPMKFEFIVNLKTAKQIGLTIPPNVLARADRVIK
jgi:ABC-type uncharacterized transport system substrate-binding protein